MQPQFVHKLPNIFLDSFAVAMILLLNQIVITDSRTTSLTYDEIVLQHYLQIRCYKESIYVELQLFDAEIANINPGLSNLVKTGYICLGSNDTVQYRNTCCSNRATIINKRKHSVQSRLDECLHQSLSYEMGPTTVFQVYFYGYRESYAFQVVEASCRGPPSGKEAVVLHASNTMFSPLFFASTFLRRAENPENISISDDIYIAPVAMISSYAVDELMTYPLNCTLKIFPKGYIPKNDTKRQIVERLIIQDGCSTEKNNVFLKQNWGLGLYANWTVIKLKNIVNILSLEQRERLINGFYEKMTVSCNVILCTTVKYNGYYNAYMCPRASFCGSRGRTLPNWVAKNHTYQTQLEIPIHNFTANDLDKQMDSNSSVVGQWNNEDAEDWWLLAEFQEDERKKALIQEITKRKIENIYKTLESEAKNKISFSIAIAMAFSFFVSGFVFSAALWIIYFRTDPRRKIRNVETTGIRPRNVTVLRPVYEPHQQYSQNYMTASSLLGSQ